jgi:hypothetical protein
VCLFKKNTPLSLTPARCRIEIFPAPTCGEGVPFFVPFPEIFLIIKYVVKVIRPEWVVNFQTLKHRIRTPPTRSKRMGGTPIQISDGIRCICNAIPYSREPLIIGCLSLTWLNLIILRGILKFCSNNKS